MPTVLMRSPSTVNALVKQVDPLTNGDRIRRIAELGRRSRRNGRLALVLGQLAEGDAYARWLSLHAALGANDGTRVVADVTNESRSVRGLAISLVAPVCDDDQAAEALHRVPRCQRVQLVQHLRRAGRRGAIDRYLRELAASGDEQLPRLLAYGSQDVVVESLGEMVDRFDLVAWARLARLHPDLAAEALKARLADTSGDEGRIVQIADVVLPPISESRPDHALELARELVTTIPIGRVRLQRLAELRPVDVADLLLAGTDPAVVSFARVADSLGVDRVEALLRRFPETLHGLWPGWWGRLPADQRAALVRRLGERWVSEDGTLDGFILSGLPNPERTRAARRLLQLEANAAYAHMRLEYAGYLEWEEARRTVDGALRSSRADERSAALSALVDAARFAPEHLGDALDVVVSHGNDQDSVRANAIGGLRFLPPSRWDATHLGRLDLVIRAALDATDLSTHTLSSLWPFVSRLLPFHGAWSARWIATMAGERDEIREIGRHGLTSSETVHLADAFAPVLARWEVGKPSLVLSLARAVGPRLPDWARLRDGAARVLAATTDANTGSQGLDLLRRYAPATLGEVVPRLLDEDPSWIRQPIVAEHLHRRRQDLLTPFLSAPALISRFTGVEGRFAVPVEGGFSQWTPSQQLIYAGMLVEMTDEPVARPTNAIFSVIRLATLPWVRSRRLVELTEPTADDPRHDLVLTAALRAMARLDGPDGLPVLVAALGDKRARVAIYVLRERLLALDPEEAMAILRAVPRDQVTVAKEVVRLTGEIRHEDAFRELLAADASVLHRDVRLALLRALWRWADREETWAIFERAASDDELAWGVVHVPTRLVPETFQPRLAALLARVLASSDASERMAVLYRLASDPVRDPENRLARPIVAALSSPVEAEAREAATAAFGFAGAGSADLIATAARSVAANPQRLKIIFDHLRYGKRWERKRLERMARAILVALEDHPVSAELRCELAVDTLPAEELRSWLDDLARRGELHADAVAAACDAIGREHSSRHRSYIYVDSFNGRYTPGTRRRWLHLDSVLREVDERSGRTDGSFGAVEAALATSDESGVRRVALAALVADADSSGGWNMERRARLEAYRDDPNLLVRAAAAFTVVPPPDEGPPDYVNV